MLLTDLENRQTATKMVAEDENVVPFNPPYKYKPETDAEKYSDAIERQTGITQVDRDTEWLMGQLKDQHDKQLKKKPSKDSTGFQSFDILTNPSTSYPLTAKLGKRMRAANLDLHGPAGEMLAEFLEWEHGGDITYPIDDFGNELIDVENATLDDFESITVKMMADIVLDLATKTRDIPREQLAEMIPKIDAVNIPGITPEQYQMIAQDFSYMFND